MHIKDRFRNEVKRIITVWECEYNQAKKENKFIQLHAKNFTDDNDKLILRETVGGKVEAMLTWFHHKLWKGGS